MAKSIPARISQRLAACGWIDSIALTAAEEFLRETPAALREMDIVWIDALQRLGMITATQAEFFYAGREAELACGLYLIARKRNSIGGIDWYDATSEGHPGYLLAISDQPLQQREVSPLAGYRGRICDTGQNGDRHWVAAIVPSGMTLAELLTRYGRMPSVAVISILRQLAHQLLSLETVGRCHGRITPETIFVSRDGVVCAPFPGLSWPSDPTQRQTSDIKQLAQLMRLLLCGIPHGKPPRVPFESLTDDAVLRELHARQTKLQPRLADWFALLGPSDTKDAKQLQTYLTDPPLVLPNLHVHLQQEAARRRKRNLAAGVGVMSLLLACGLFWPSGDANLPAQFGEPPASWTPIAAKPLPPPEMTPAVAPASTEIHLASAEIPVSDSRRIGLPKSLTAGEFPANIPDASTVAAADGQRTTIKISATPLLLSAEKLTLERIDFVASGESTATGRTVLVEVAAASIELRNCTFRWEGAESSESIALAWRPTPRTSRGLRSLPEAKLADCQFSGVLIGLDVTAHGDAAVELTKCRYEGVGGLVRTKADASPLRFHFLGTELSTIGGMLWHHFQSDPQAPFSASAKISESHISPLDNGAAVAIIGGGAKPFAPAIRFDLVETTIADDAPLATFFDGEQFHPLTAEDFSR
ncbi:hypothetical protein [Blastopirellula marina]|uniref:Protein kinase domain-containing protein n=1 Tax=Blastopirellula marina TaxID=124 RepID=A0A2S8GM75_9BACT|nr:hypothetical protein [Blastopirellula marina]PQO45114.1 hypothetical protein C5Y93_16405 [Blastopirellula marina]